MFTMPILGDPARPVYSWHAWRRHYERAKANHCGQTLHTLSDRGGLSWTELYCIVADVPLSSIQHDSRNTEICRKWLLNRGSVSYRSVR